MSNFESAFSLLNVSNHHPDGTVDGYWLQDHIGSYEGAVAKARATEKVNSNKITVAVVKRIDHPAPRLEFWTNRRLAVG